MGRGLGGRNYFDPVKRLRPAKVGRYADMALKPFGKRAAAVRYAKTALRLGFEISPFKRGLLIAEAIEAGFTLAELGAAIS